MMSPEETTQPANSAKVPDPVKGPLDASVGSPKVPELVEGLLDASVGSSKVPELVEGTSQGSELRAAIFDLDGVITDTAEYHYQAWQRLADEEGLAFSRLINEKLRGVSRRESLAIILQGRQRPEAEVEEMMRRKNGYYVELLANISPADLLPGVLSLVAEFRANGYATAIASASKNTPRVLAGLGIAAEFDQVVDGNADLPAKPAPDVFLEAARRVGFPPSQCVVFEDAAAGIDGALAAGCWTVGLGPHERVGHAHLRLDGLGGFNLNRLLEELNAARSRAGSDH